MLGALFVVAKVQEKLEKFGNNADACGVHGILKKLDPGQVDEAATSLVRIASKFKHNPPTSLGVIVGKSGIACRSKEDGVYVVPITALRA